MLHANTLSQVASLMAVSSIVVAIALNAMQMLTRSRKHARQIVRIAVRPAAAHITRRIPRLHVNRRPLPAANVSTPV